MTLLFSFGCTYIYMPILTLFSLPFLLIIRTFSPLQGIHGRRGGALEESTLIVILPAITPFFRMMTMEECVVYDLDTCLGAFL